MNSFYGGKEGRTYHIVKAFPTISSMTSAFGQGAGYPDVAYGEYVIIDTESKNDKDNGKIYRRGLNFTNASSGAIYIGQIQGPEGRIPPMTMAESWEEFLTYGVGQSTGSTFSVIEDGISTVYKVVDKATTFSPPTTKKAYDNGVANPIKIGFETYADEDQITRKGIIGIDIPQPVVKVNSTVAPAPSSGAFTPITTTTLSQNLTSQGVQYYEYDVNIPIASNFEIKRTQGIGNNFSTYSLQYNTVTPANEYGIVSSTVDFSLVDGMRYHPNNTDLIQYHISGSNASTLNSGWRDLFNPNGQFHIYAKRSKKDWSLSEPETLETLQLTTWIINETPQIENIQKTFNINLIVPSLGDDSFSSLTIQNNQISFNDFVQYRNNRWLSDAFRTITIINGDDVENTELINWLQNNAVYGTILTDSIAVEKLNEEFPYGIRTPIKENEAIVEYDITQAGWLISVELEKIENNIIKNYSALYAYDYLPAQGYEEESYTLEDFKQIAPSIHPKGWFQVQDFNSSLASDPEEIIIIGTEEAASPSTISLKQNGLWLQGYEKGGKWWLQEI